MNLLAFIFTFASIGIAETVYLIKQRRLTQAPVCFIGGECHKVLESKYNKILGVHNDLLGFLYYATVAVLIGITVVRVELVDMLQFPIFLLVLSGAFASIYFTFLQWKIIKVWCFWCLMSATTTWIMTIIVILNMIIKI